MAYLEIDCPTAERIAGTIGELEKLLRTWRPDGGSGEVLLRGGAKLCHNPRKGWSLVGYHYAGKDVERVLEIIGGGGRWLIAGSQAPRLAN